MTAVGDIFQLKQFVGSNLFAERMLNVFWYRLSAWGSIPVGDPVAAELAVEFAAKIVTALRDVVTTTTVVDKVEVVNYADTQDFVVCDTLCGFPVLGLRAGETMPLANCWTFRINRPFPGTRNGYKRISGISETDVVNGSASAPVTPLLAACGLEMQKILISANGVSFVPVVATGPKVLGFNPMYNETSVFEYAGIGTQNSRKQRLTP